MRGRVLGVGVGILLVCTGVVAAIIGVPAVLGVPGLFDSTATAATAATVLAVRHPLAAPLWVDPHGVAAESLATQSSSTRSRLRVLTTTSTANWLTGHDSSIRSAVAAKVNSAKAAHRSAVLVMYDIPHRDCSHYSGGGAANATAYRAWVRGFVAGLGTARSIVIVEPDALAQMQACLNQSAQAARLALLKYAVTQVAAQGSLVYLDAGHANWVDPATTASRLQRAGIASASGFSVNVASFRTTAESIRFGTAVSNLVSGKHFVIDTSRNGRAPVNATWCNPRWAGLGVRPTTTTASVLVDAYLWIKTPGVSDGSCAKGDPKAGVWFPAYARQLVANAAK